MRKIRYLLALAAALAGLVALAPAAQAGIWFAAPAASVVSERPAGTLALGTSPCGSTAYGCFVNGSSHHVLVRGLTGGGETARETRPGWTSLTVGIRDANAFNVPARCTAYRSVKLHGAAFYGPARAIPGPTWSGFGNAYDVSVNLVC